MLEFLSWLAFAHRAARLTGCSPESVAQAVDSVINAYARERR